MIYPLDNPWRYAMEVPGSSMDPPWEHGGEGDGKYLTFLTSVSVIGKASQTTFGTSMVRHERC